MSYKIEIDKPAMKFLQRQPPEQRTRLLRAIQGLPDIGDVKPMAGFSGLFRLRVGTCRVLYTVENASLIIRVIAVGNRGDVYK